MGLGIETAFAVPQKALQLRAYRAGVLAHNLANADTPGYKARDFDFRRAMGGEAGSVRSDRSSPPLSSTRLLATHTKHYGARAVGGRDDVELSYRAPMQPSLDNNTVETPAEHAHFMDNAIRYQATLTLLSGKVRGLLTAITGQ